MAPERKKVYPGFIAPDGTEYKEVKNLVAFCREHSLIYTAMVKLAQGKVKHHKGWKCLQFAQRVFYC